MVMQGMLIHLKQTMVYRITELASVHSTKGKTIIIWYKGTQTNNAGHYSIGVPILSRYTNTWAGIWT